MFELETYPWDPSRREPPAEDELAAPACLLVTHEDCSLDITATIELLLATEPGPDVHAATRVLADLPEQLVGPAERVDLMVLLERCDAALAGAKQPLLAALARAAGSPELTPGRHEDVALELGLALHWSEFMVDDRMGLAQAIDERLPRTSAALKAGRISFLQAREIAEATAILTRDDDPADPAAVAATQEKLAEIERRLLPRVERKTRAETRRLARRAVMIADPKAAEARRKTARHGRRVIKYAEDDGEASLVLRGPAEDVATMWNAATAGADRLLATGDVATLDQGRFDAMLAMATDYVRRLDVPQPGVRPTWLNVIVGLDTLAGKNDLPAELEGYGPITAQTARDLAMGLPARPGPHLGPSDRPYTFEGGLPIPDPPDDWLDPPDDEPPDPPPDPDPPLTPPTDVRTQLRWRVLPIDTTTGWLLPTPGLRLDYGRSRRFATPGQAEYIRLRDRTCSLPICAMPGSRGEVDHWPGWDEGSPTDAASMGLGCVHHNRTTRNRAGWRIEPHGDGSATLRTPQGREYPIQPHDYLG